MGNLLEHFDNEEAKDESYELLFKSLVLSLQGREVTARITPEALVDVKGTPTLTMTSKEEFDTGDIIYRLTTNVLPDNPLRDHPLAQPERKEGKTMTQEECLGVAARIWGDAEMKEVAMCPELCEDIAKMIFFNYGGLVWELS